MARKKQAGAAAVSPSGLKPVRSAPLPAAVWAALTLALGIRLSFLFFSKDAPFFEPLILDPKYYHAWALRIAGGDFVGEGVFHGLPLYPFFLALVYKLFHQSLWAVKLAQGALGVLTVFLVYKIGEKLHSKKAGILGAYFAALYGPLFFHEQILIPESLGVPLYALSFYMACAFAESPTMGRGIVLGFCAALAALTKAGILPFVILLPVLFWLRNRRNPFPAKIFAVSGLAFFLTLSPVTLHNWVYGHDFVPLTSHGGFNFYIGNNPNAEGVFVAPEGTGGNVDAQIADSRAVAEREAGRSLKPSAVSAFWSAKAWRYIRENPLDFARLLWTKFVLFFDAREISDVEDYEFAKNFNPMLRWPWLDFSVVGPLFVLGIVLSSRTMRERLTLYGWIACYVGAILFFFVNARYRLPLLSVFLPVAAAGFLEIYDSVRERRWTRIALCLAALGLGMALSRAELVGNDHLKDYLNAGDAYQEKKEYDRAKVLYEKALVVNPRAPKANLAMGVLLTRLGNPEEAKTYYEKCVAEDPDNSQALNNLGLWYDRVGRLEEAEAYFLKAATAKPNSSEAHNNLGMVYGKTGRLEPALEELETSLRLNPRSARAHTNVGLVYYRLGNAAEARRHWEKALEIDPDFEEARKAVRLLAAHSQNAF